MRVLLAVVEVSREWDLFGHVVTLHHRHGLRRLIAARAAAAQPGPQRSDSRGVLVGAGGEVVTEGRSARTRLSGCPWCAGFQGAGALGTAVVGSVACISVDVVDVELRHREGDIAIFGIRVEESAVTVGVLAGGGDGDLVAPGAGRLRRQADTIAFRDSSRVIISQLRRGVVVSDG